MTNEDKQFLMRNPYIITHMLNLDTFSSLNMTDDSPRIFYAPEGQIQYTFREMKRFKLVLESKLGRVFYE